MILGFWFFSDEDVEDAPLALVPESFRGVWPGVSTLPFMARSLAAALSAEHLFPRTSGSGGKDGVLFAGGLLSCKG